MPANSAEDQFEYQFRGYAVAGVPISYDPSISSRSTLRPGSQKVSLGFIALLEAQTPTTERQSRHQSLARTGEENGGDELLAPADRNAEHSWNVNWRPEQKEPWGLGVSSTGLSTNRRLRPRSGGQCLDCSRSAGLVESTLRYLAPGGGSVENRSTNGSGPAPLHTSNPRTNPPLSFCRGNYKRCQDAWKPRKNHPRPARP
jgi:hypothetical protein